MCDDLRVVCTLQTFGCVYDVCMLCVDKNICVDIVSGVCDDLGLMCKLQRLGCMYDVCVCVCYLLVK